MGKDNCVRKDDGVSKGRKRRKKPKRKIKRDRG